MQTLKLAESGLVNTCFIMFVCLFIQPLYPFSVSKNDFITTPYMYI